MPKSEFETVVKEMLDNDEKLRKLQELKQNLSRGIEMIKHNANFTWNLPTLHSPDAQLKDEWHEKALPNSSAM